jgi:hypothetical protein
MATQSHIPTASEGFTPGLALLYTIAAEQGIPCTGLFPCKPDVKLDRFQQRFFWILWTWWIMFRHLFEISKADFEFEKTEFLDTHPIVFTNHALFTEQDMLYSRPFALAEGGFYRYNRDNYPVFFNYVLSLFHYKLTDHYDAFLQFQVIIFIPSWKSGIWW